MAEISIQFPENLLDIASKMKNYIGSDSPFTDSLIAFLPRKLISL